MTQHFVKHPKKGYCYSYFKNVKLDVMCVFNYLIQEHIIEKTPFIKDLMTQFYELGLVSEPKHFKVSCLDYYTREELHINDEDNAYYHLDLIKREYDKTQKLNALFETYLTLVDIYQEPIEKIKMSQLEPYMNLQIMRQEYTVKRAEKIEKNNQNGVMSQYQGMNYFTLLNELKREYANETILKAHPEILKNPFTSLVKNWGEILNHEGQVIHIESVLPETLLDETHKYALYTSNEKSSGYLYIDKDYHYKVKLQNATLFNSIIEAQEFIKKNNVDAVICQIDVKLSHIVKNKLDVDTTDLDVIFIQREKAKIEKKTNKIKLIYELMNYLNEKDGELKLQLDEALKQHNDIQPSLKKTQKKI